MHGVKKTDHSFYRDQEGKEENKQKSGKLCKSSFRGGSHTLSEGFSSTKTLRRSPGPLWLLQCGCPPSGSDPSLPAPPFFLFFGPSPPLVPRATGPSSGPPSTAGDTLPLAPSPCSSLAATTCRDRSRVPPFPPETFGDVVGD